MAGKAPNILTGGAVVRQILDAGDGAYCAASACTREATWAVYQELYDAQDDPEWFACSAHLEAVAVEAIDYDEDADQ